MMAMVSVLVFSGACAASIGVIIATVAPQWRRILTLAAGQAETQFAPLATLAIAERRIAVRRWSTESAPVGSWRAAA